MGLEQEEKIPLLSPRKKNACLAFSFHVLIRYLCISFMVLAHLFSFTTYLVYKCRLYGREYRAVWAAPWLLVILFCECGYFLSSFMYCLELLLPPWFNTKPPCPLPDNEKDFPTVDILLPCCKEPTDIPVDTILAALAVDYPPHKLKVLVLDDGADDDLKSFCECLKVETGGAQIDYLRRIKIPGVPHNYKSGNLNYGLEHSTAEYVLMVDADMIIDPSFVRTLLPFIMDSPNVAFVQVPQAYYNLPIGDPLNDASASFYENVLVKRNIWGCPSCVGTGAMFRRAHLDAIGGYQHYSITEDCMTSYVLFREGYRAVYVNKKLQMGLTPWTFERYLKQRERWCIGSIQQFSSTWKSMLGRRSKLNPLDKVIFVAYTYYYYLSFLNILMLTVFISSLAFRLNLAIGNSLERRTFIVYLAAYLVIWRLTWIIQWWGTPQQVQSRNREESHFWWMTPFFFLTILRGSFPSLFTFTFVATASTTDPNAKSMKSKMPLWIKSISQFKHLTFHLTYASIVISLVLWQSYIAHTRGGFHNFRELTFVGGISMFLLSTCIHMLVPFFYMVWPTGFHSSMRKEILQYDEHGVPLFSEIACTPKWHWPVVAYEIMSYCIIVIWVGVFFVAVFELDNQWWKE